MKHRGNFSLPFLHIFHCSEDLRRLYSVQLLSLRMQKLAGGYKLPVLKAGINILQLKGIISEVCHPCYVFKLYGDVSSVKNTTIHVCIYKYYLPTTLDTYKQRHTPQRFTHFYISHTCSLP